MRLVQYYELDRVRLELTLESKDTLTHSQMQSLTVEQQTEIRYRMLIFMTYISELVQINELAR